MRILYLTDRWSTLGGADHHLRAVVGAMVEAGHRVRVAAGRLVDERCPASLVRIRGLASPVASTARLGALAPLLADADVIHLQNVMNPVVLERVVETGRAVVTVQDHRVFCPGPGRTLPDGRACDEPMGEEPCRVCLDEPVYRARTLALTRARLSALRGARLVVLSAWMARELSRAGLPGATVVPPWVELGPEPAGAGEGFVLAGRLVSHKAPLQAWRAWQQADTAQPLWVAGQGPLSAGLTGARQLGWLSSSALLERLRSARALLFAGRWQEPFGILGLEALSQGTPVVVMETGGVADWAGAGCWRIPAGDVDAMAAAIRALAGQPELAERMGRAGWEAAQAWPDQRALTARLEAVYQAGAHG